MKVIWVGLLGIFCVLVAVPVEVSALSRVVISQLQTGDTVSGSNEAVELYNNTEEDVDISGWCIRYTTASAQVLQPSPKYCFTPPDAQTKIFLSAHSYATIVTTGYIVLGGMSPDGRFSGSGMAASGGHIRLLDAEGIAHDVLGWGTSVFAEGYLVLGNPAPVAPTATQSLTRKTFVAPLLQDTDNNRVDFEIKVPGMRAGGVYEVHIPVDVCGDLPGVQETMPDGLGYDEAGNCELLSADLCTNLSAIQTTVPSGLVRDETDGGCYADACPNLEHLQRTMPAGYGIKNDTCYALEHRPILLSELLANVAGTDAGHEFIELYNPHEVPIALEGYHLEMGNEYSTRIVLASGVIPAYGYVAYYDDDLGFSLLNTENSIRLTAPAGNIVSQTDYSSPKEDESWALIDGVWQYTDAPTPGSRNLGVEASGGMTEGVATSRIPCPSGRYRHPITNRCRNIESDAKMLVACDADEYRNPETNRCRKITNLTAAFTPCQVGYERNPETNRCRSAARATSLTPCKAGYERNPATNRCRKAGTTVTALKPCQSGYERNPATNRCRKANLAANAAATPAAITHAQETAPLRTALVVTVGVGAVGYALYEWRSELSRFVRRASQGIKPK